ncbi:hypothetical protein H6A13_00290 [Mordavella massiliensis]|uniref:Uncharacterized protein n=1 Tax=Mordavella massiliensis TaxID=1871024 RepID=A0A938X0M1_9CLOT|nr:hypothetical protein [Mordavella massiliensis]
MASAVQVFSFSSSPNETCDLNTGYETVRMTVQPTSEMAFKGDWGRCPNKQFLKIEPEAKLKK